MSTEVQAIVPVKALGEVARLAASMGDGDLEVAIGENQALFKLSDPGGDVWIASRLIDGQFPNYKQLLPDTFDHEVTLAERRVHGGGAARQPAGAEERAAAPGVRGGTAHDEGAHAGRRARPRKHSTIEFAGEAFEIGFNPAYLIEGIDAIDEAGVLLRFTSPLRPGLVSGADGDFVYLIMPIRLSS